VQRAAGEQPRDSRQSGLLLKAVDAIKDRSVATFESVRPVVRARPAAAVEIRDESGRLGLQAAECRYVYDRPAYGVSLVANRCAQAIAGQHE
jgi:type IV secretory pathway protease TraF